MAKPEYIVSACLAGFNCKYNGRNNTCDIVQKLYQAGKAIPVCPETLGGLKAPREPSEIKSNGTVKSKSGKDLSSSFEKGAILAMDIAKQSGCLKAIVKERSPSCGLGTIYDGSFSGTLRKGNGKWTEKLLAAGIEVWTEENLPLELV